MTKDPRQAQTDATDLPSAFATEVARLRKERVPGASGRLRDLFDFLADRGYDAGPATQAEISAGVFGQPAPETDDATVRVYVHRLRKRLEDHYAAEAGERTERLEIPAGTYALRFVGEEPATEADPGESSQPKVPAPLRWQRRFWPIAAALALLAAFGAGWLLSSRPEAEANALWQPFLASDRPVLVMVGDYYMFGEIDPVRPEEGRLIRDFRVNSPADLQRMQDLQPGRFAGAEDVGLNYLPFSAAYGLQAIVPLLERHDENVSIIAASQFAPDMLNRYDIIYVGLLSGMGLLEDITFGRSGFALGESYDEVIDSESGRSFVSDEFRSVATPAYYRDYGYVARYRAPGGALVAVIGGSRDTGLRGLSQIVSGPELPADLADAARDELGIEALFQITGQQGADLSERLLVARARESDTR